MPYYFSKEELNDLVNWANSDANPIWNEVKAANCEEGNCRLAIKYYRPKDHFKIGQIIDAPLPYLKQTKYYVTDIRDKEVEITEIKGTTSEKPQCKCYSSHCAEHGFFHGAEAEELREKFENLIKNKNKISANQIQKILDSVDARDSLAYLEFKKEQEKQNR